MNTEETLRVVPVDQRPEFVAQGKVDDSQTRIFGKLKDETQSAPEAPKAEPEKAAQAPQPEEKPAEAESDTIRIDRAAIDAEMKRQADAAGSGKKRSELKPMKKKKKGLFGRKREDDDLFDGEDTFDDTDDDFIE